MVKMLGFTKGRELLGKSFSTILAPDDRRTTMDRFYSRRKGNTESYEITFTRKDGSLFPAVLAPAPLFENGVFKGSFATIKDITKQKLLLDRVRASEARFKALAEQLPAAICEIDSHQSILYLNEFAKKLFKLRTIRATAKCSFQDLIPHDEHARLDRILCEAQDGREPEPFLMDISPHSIERIPVLWNVALTGRLTDEASLLIVMIEIKELLSGFFFADRQRLGGLQSHGTGEKRSEASHYGYALQRNRGQASHRLADRSHPHSEPVHEDGHPFERRAGRYRQQVPRGILRRKFVPDAA
jgi:PAS domain S-box-containing protein